MMRIRRGVTVLYPKCGRVTYDTGGYECGTIVQIIGFRTLVHTCDGDLWFATSELKQEPT